MNPSASTSKAKADTKVEGKADTERSLSDEDLRSAMFSPAGSLKYVKEELSDADSLGSLSDEELRQALQPCAVATRWKFAQFGDLVSNFDVALMLI